MMVGKLISAGQTVIPNGKTVAVSEGTSKDGAWKSYEGPEEKRGPADFREKVTRWWGSYQMHGRQLFQMAKKSKFLREHQKMEAWKPYEGRDKKEVLKP
ncbi:hypothetical protein R3W88_032184 [Solanum pinnatisectum]|uniref:Uncharacterized protein n=1 Tax=Solanum pinnatisectum TaxID=50273 RepID=A0AAV9LNF4_9SOLN|nr:hypothetical protein R3W88_032184 [Solanum pinnatisectum]